MPLCADVPATLEACVNNGNGMLRLVDAATASHANETRVQWSVTGDGQLERSSVSVGLHAGELFFGRQYERVAVHLQWQRVDGERRGQLPQ